MPLQATSGAASYDAFGGGVPVVPVYIEDVMSTWLYTGTGASQTITNGIDLSGKGGLTWIKARTQPSFASNNTLFDTIRGTGKQIYSDLTSAQATDNTSLTAFNATGFTLGTDSTGTVNYSGHTFASWTFRKQPKFFDVVTWTGTGSNTTIAHNLGSVPAMIIVKKTNGAGDWWTYHQSLGNTQFLRLNTTASAGTSATIWNSTTPTSSVFSLGNTSANAIDDSYVAYLFAHDAGGFGLTGTDNVISCGSYTTNGSGVASVTLGYEPQWILWKRSDSTSDWYIFDTMRGWTGDPANTSAGLRPNLSNAENNLSGYAINATGFNVTAGAASATYIYIAIRRGPMKVPTSGTSVFSLDASSAGGSGGLLGAITASDLVINSQRDPAANSPFVFIDRLRGVGQVNTGATTKALYSSNTNAETTVDTTSSSSTAEGVNGAYLYSAAGKSSAIRTVQQGPGGSVAYNLIRAPGFFDEVCYTGDSTTGRSITHNLGVAPELMIVKGRNVATKWAVYCAPLGNTKAVYLNQTSSIDTTNRWNDTTPTSSVFYLSNDIVVNDSSYNYVWYGFATCAGVSKVGSYTGNGTTQTIDCGFTGGARFVLIKRTDSTGDWYVYDTARGIVSGNDPYLLLNSTAAEVTSTDYIDTYSAGFEISSTAPAAINASGGSFIFFAVS